MTSVDPASCRDLGIICGRTLHARSHGRVTKGSDVPFAAVENEGVE
jgi:hypothetical protein